MEQYVRFLFGLCLVMPQLALRQYKSASSSTNFLSIFLSNYFHPRPSEFCPTPPFQSSEHRLMATLPHSQLPSFSLVLHQSHASNATIFINVYRDGATSDAPLMTPVTTAVSNSFILFTVAYRVRFQPQFPPVPSQPASAPVISAIDRFARAILVIQIYCQVV